MIIWQGKSRFKQKENVSVVATFNSDNKKTGKEMIQTWILPEKEFIKSESRENRIAVCGSCPLIAARACYVNFSKAVLSIWNKLNRKEYPEFNLNPFRDRMVRLGSYGEIVNTPINLIRRILKVSSGHTGYTHSWAKKWAQPWSEYLMASCTSLTEKNNANALGWRTFRVVKSLKDIVDDEVE